MAQAGGTNPAGVAGGAAVGAARSSNSGCDVSDAAKRRCAARPTAPQFASDNNAGICPEAWDALVAKRTPATRPATARDDWTAAAVARDPRRVRDATATCSSCSTARRPTALGARRDLPQHRCDRVPRDGAHQRRRVRRAGVHVSGGAKLAHHRRAARQAHARGGDRARGHAARRALVAPARAVAHAGDRARHAVHARRDVRARATSRTRAA